MNPEIIAVGVVWYVAFLFSTTCHESAHALAAKLGGDPTAFHSGQATLNPWPHIRRSPFGTVLVPIVSYLMAGWMIGWASAPYDPSWEQRYPRRAAWMALAGPAANFTLMILAGIGIRIGMALGHFRLPSNGSFDFTHIVEATQGAGQSFPTVFLSVLFVLNLVLGTFNLLPFPPLDGNSAITLLLPQRVALRFIDWTRQSGYGPLGLILAWVIYGRIFHYLFAIALLALYPELFSR
jgi:Zn-dependent protease